MSVTEYERNQLFVWFEQHMTKELAATMMSLLPPVGWGDVATRRDLDLAVERLDTKIDAVAERFDLKIDAVAERFDLKIDAVAEQLDLKIDAVADRLRSDLQRTFVTWMFAAQGAVVATVGLLLALLR